MPVDDGTIPELSEFIHTVMGVDDHNEQETVCLTRKQGDKWQNRSLTDRVLAEIEADEDGAWYFCISTVVRPPRGAAPSRKSGALQTAMVLVLDDIGTKVEEGAITVAPSYILETSEGNFQYGYLLDPVDVSDPEQAEYFDACTRGLGAAGLTDAGMRGAWRVARLPGSLHRTGFRARLVSWSPSYWFALPDLMTALGVEPAERRKPLSRVPGHTTDLDDIDDPVLDWFRARGALTGGGNDRFIEVECPWADEHTTGGSVAGYSPYGYGDIRDAGYSCLHEHCADRSVADLRMLMQADARATANVVEARRFPKLDPAGLPDCVMNKKGPAVVQKLTRDNVAWVVASWGLRLRFDMMRHQVSLHDDDGALDLNGAHTFATFRSMLVSELARLGISSGAGGVLDEHLVTLAAEDKFHPAEDWLRSLSWDGVDHIAELAATVRTDTPLWKVYLTKWLIQCVDAACGWREEPVAIPHVLTFTGPQGVGKSTWFARLAPPVPGAYLGDASLHLDQGGGKDSMLSVLSHWIVEVGEVDGTYKKSEQSVLKNFLSRSTDEIRAPYAKAHVTRPRLTSFCATVNETAFLQDSTGSRRWWPVEVEAIDRDGGRDISGVWAHAYALWSAGADYYLTDAENQIRITESEWFTDVRPITQRIVDFFGEERMAMPKSEWLPLSVMEIARVVDIRDAALAHPAALKDVGAGVRSVFGEPRKIWGLKRRFLVPVRESELNVYGIVAPKKPGFQSV